VHLVKMDPPIERRYDKAKNEMPSTCLTLATTVY
jgi:hypothetical protein